MITSIENKKTQRGAYSRQIAFAAAFLLPTAKFLEVPRLLAKYSMGDLLLPALLHALSQTLVLLAVLYAASRSEIPLIERLKAFLGKGIYLLYGIYALYFLFAAVLPLLDMEKFVYAAFFDTAPTTFSFAFFFIFSAFVCTKGIKAILRSADICLFLFLLPFLALVVMGFSAADFSNLMPLFSVNFSASATAFRRSQPYFSDVILLLPLLLNLSYKKGDGVKIVAGYAVGSLFTLLFLSVFFGIYASIAAREHYAFSKIAQYFPALSVVGRIDLIFVYLLSVVLLFYTCLPLQYATLSISSILGTKRQTFVSALLNFFLFIGVLFLNKYYDTIHNFVSGNLFFVFIIFADMVPLFLLFLPKTEPNRHPHLPRKKGEFTYA